MRPHPARGTQSTRNRPHRRHPGHPGRPRTGTEEELLAAERHAALREALTHLPPCCQQLITLLAQDLPPSYCQISARLGVPEGSIGPSRARCLDKLRRHPAIAALINPHAGTAA